ncbi:MAG: iron-sulfur cluster repair di-iron protein [Weeksellaceae bacterium]
MELTAQSNIGKLVADNYKTASVFKKHGIDFCCQGNRSIEDACTRKKIDSEKVLRELSEVYNSSNDENIDFKSWPLDLLADYIEKKHHRYVEEKSQEIIPFLYKVSQVHGERHPELLEIYQHFMASTQDLAAHLKKEELILFPYVRKVVKAQQGTTTLEQPHFGKAENPIEVMMGEHDVEGERFRKIAALSDNYTPPADACSTYKVTFAMLKEFEDDLHHHIHLENNILFPRTIALEEQLRMN